MSRPRGSLTRRTDSLIREITNVDDGDLLERLATVTGNEELPLRMRLDALKLLSGALHGRIRLSQPAKVKLSKELEAR